MSLQEVKGWQKLGNACLIEGALFGKKPPPDPAGAPSVTAFRTCAGVATGTKAAGKGMSDNLA